MKINRGGRTSFLAGDRRKAKKKAISLDLGLQKRPPGELEGGRVRKGGDGRRGGPNKTVTWPTGGEKRGGVELE